jgi:outer membrane lipopolysaccharide assembly protein LptE/RlpB
LQRCLAFCFLLIVWAALCGCGYYPVRGTADPGSGIARGVHIPIFANKSYRPGLEAILTTSLAEAFARRSGGMVVGEEAAQLVLNGAVLSYSVVPVSYTAADRIREYRSILKVEATLTDRQSRKVLWKGELSGSQEYPANATNVSLQQNSEEAAVREICRNLAEQIYEKIREDF